MSRHDPADGPRVLPMPALVALGIVVGVLVGGMAIVASGVLEDDGGVRDVTLVPSGEAQPVPSAAAADRLITAIRRSRTATFVLVEEHRRVAPNGAEVSATRTTRVQRPPDSLVRTDGLVDVVRGGTRTSCVAAPDQGGRLRCRTEPAAAVDVEAAVREEASLLTGPAPLYTVAEQRGCFRLVLRVERPAPPYGRRATLCFDAGTGALTSSEVVKALGDGTGGEVVDRISTSDVRGAVTDADLAVPEAAAGP